jgi:hypothetical protein
LKLKGGLKTLYNNEDILKLKIDNITDEVIDNDNIFNHITQGDIQDHLRDITNNAKLNINKLNESKINDIFSNVLKSRSDTALESKLETINNARIVIYYKRFKQLFYDKFKHKKHEDLDRLWSSISLSIAEFLILFLNDSRKINNKFKLIKCLGKGSFNVVYLGEIYDVKIVIRIGRSKYHHDRYNTSRNGIRRYKHEIFNTSKLIDCIKHNNIIYLPKVLYSIYDFVNDNNYNVEYDLITSWSILPVYINIPYHKKIPIPNNLIKEYDTDEIDYRLVYINSVFKACEYILDNDLYYYDWKYSNVMYNPETKNFVLVDFDIPSYESHVYTYKPIGYILDDNFKIYNFDNKACALISVMLDIINYYNVDKYDKYVSHFSTPINEYYHYNDTFSEKIAALIIEYITMYRELKHTESKDICQKFITKIIPDSNNNGLKTFFSKRFKSVLNTL